MPQSPPMPTRAPFTMYPHRTWIMLRMAALAIVFGASSIGGIWIGVRQLARGSLPAQSLGWIVVCGLTLLLTGALLYGQSELLADRRPLLAADRSGVWIRLPHGVVRPVATIRFLPWPAVDAVFLQSYRVSADGDPSTYLCVRPKGSPGEMTEGLPDAGPIRFGLGRFGTPFAIDLSDVRVSEADIRVALDRLLPAGMRLEERPEIG
jgi:hypothetical protein